MNGLTCSMTLEVEIRTLYQIKIDNTQNGSKKKQARNALKDEIDE